MSDSLCHTHKMYTCMKLAGENWEAFFLCLLLCSYRPSTNTKSAHCKEKLVTEDDFFLIGGWGCVFVNSCIVAGASHYSCLGPYVLARL